MSTFETFKNGSTWLRADFHLHTKADTEFKYDGPENDFIKKYVQQLKDKNINICVVTNHNKFDLNEFKALRKSAKKEEIFILPGIELSVKDGSNGIHTLVVFDDSWLSDGNDFINDFLKNTFTGQSNFENRNSRSNDDLQNTIKKLDEFNKDYFCIMAHIESKNGFYEELDGGRIKEFGKDKLFRSNVLAFQKVRTRDKIEKLNNWLNGLPAFVEGSDPKKIEDIGVGNVVQGITQESYLKIGSFSFESVKYALTDFKNRLSTEIPKIDNAYIKSIEFQSQKLGSDTIYLNNSMNNLIGIRGSGKSSILETIRYALDKELKSGEKDAEYKNNIVSGLLGSGGKISLEIIDKRNNSFSTVKILNEQTHIYQNEELKENLKVTSLINKPVYFGQKDLSESGKGSSTADLLERLLGDIAKSKREEIKEKETEIKSLIEQIEINDSKLSKKDELNSKKAELELKLENFKTFEIEDKLNKELKFGEDENRIKKIISLEKKIISYFKKFITDSKTQLSDFPEYKSSFNQKLFTKIDVSYKNFTDYFKSVSKFLSDFETEYDNLIRFQDTFNTDFEELKEEFSKVKREINLPQLNTDDFVRWKKDLDRVKNSITELDKISKTRLKNQKLLSGKLTELKQLWHDQFTIVKEEIKTINQSQSLIEIKTIFKGDKEAFFLFLKQELQGSNLRARVIQEIANGYNDNIDIYSDIQSGSGKIYDILSRTKSKDYFVTTFFDKLFDFLIFRIKEKYEILYKGRLLQEHSLGQRASALIIFILTLKDNDLIIIDQPEDDLDNQTIYTDVIKELIKLKNKTQFIFATHNPNIPVLGDCEMIICCDYIDEKIETTTGSIDTAEIQEKIVNIMEGGDEAFQKRNEIYKLWHN